MGIIKSRGREFDGKGILEKRAAAQQGNIGAYGGTDEGV